MKTPSSNAAEKAHEDEGKGKRKNTLDQYRINQAEHQHHPLHQTLNVIISSRKKAAWLG
jgi:hypothetical protein